MNTADLIKNGPGPVKVMISYAHDSHRHRESVAELAEFLRAAGLDVSVDLDVRGRELWPAWTAQKFREATFILVIASPAYKERAEDRGDREVGLGVRNEARFLQELLWGDFDTESKRILPVYLPGGSAADLPDWILPRAATVYPVSEFSATGASELLRVLLGPVGSVRAGPEPAGALLGPINVLHLSDLQAGAGGSAGTGPQDGSGDQLDALQADLVDQIGAGDRPDLIVVSGGLAGSGTRPQMQRALEFLEALARAADVSRERIVIVPGEHDVSRELAQAYFLQCIAEGRTPESPYWRKWDNFIWLQRSFYGPESDSVFAAGAPWSTIVIPELKVVVIGLNTTVAQTHEVQGGMLGLAQCRAAAAALEQHERSGWLRIAVMHHSPFAADADGRHQLSDADQFGSVLGSRLNIVLHGHPAEARIRHLPGGPAVSAVGRVPGADAGSPGGAALRYQWLRFTTAGLRRRIRVQPEIGSAWRDDPLGVEEGLTDLGLGRVPAIAPAEDPATGVEVLEPPRPPDLVDGLRELAELRHRDSQVERIDATDGVTAHLRIRRIEGTIIEMRVVAAVAGSVAASDIESFRRSVLDPYLQLYPGAFADLVYFGPDPAGPALRQLARSRGVQLFSVQEYQGVLDLREYLVAQSDRLNRNAQYPPYLYVPQRMSRLDAGDREPVRDAVAQVADWLAVDRAQFVLVLGDFGRGKTFLLHELARRLAAEQPGVIPILIELRHLQKQQALETLVAAHLTDAGVSRFEPEAFRYMFEAGRIVLLFDGFDELAVRVTYPQAAEHLGVLTAAVRGKAKIVLTSRAQHFLTDSQVLSALTGQVEAVPSTLAQLEEFTDQQILLFLERLYAGERPPPGATAGELPAERARIRMELIRTIQLDLARNPRMLYFIATLSEQRLRSAVRTSGRLKPAGLYEHLVDEWLRYEETRARRKGAPPGVRRGSRRSAATRLALQMWRTGQDVGHDELNDAAVELLAEMADPVMMTNGEMAQVLGSGTLLVRDENGRFRFIHASVMEFLVASAVVEGLGPGPNDRRGQLELLAHREMSGLMIDFLVDLADRDVLTAWIRDVLDAPNITAAAGINAENVAKVAGIPIRTGHRLADTNQAGRDLSALDLGGADLQRADLSYAVLAGNDMTGADLRHTTLTGATLSGVRAPAVPASDSVFTQARIDTAYLRGVNLRGAGLQNARICRTDLREADLREANLLGARLSNVDLRDARLAGSNWARTVLTGCQLSAGADESAHLVGAARPETDPVELMVAPPSAPATALAYSPGLDLLACAYGHFVLLVEHSTGQVVRSLPGHPSRVMAVCFAEDGLLVSASAEGSVQFWHAAEGRAITALPPEEGRVSAIGLTGPGLLVVARATGTVAFWQVGVDRPPQLVGGLTETFEVSTLAVSAGRLAVGGGPGPVQLWDITDPAVPRRDGTLGSETAEARVSAFTPDGAVLAVAAGSISLWACGPGSGPRLTRTLTGSEAGVSGLAFSRDRRLLAVASADGTSRLWDLEDDANSRVLPGHSDRVNAVVFTTDDGTLVSGSSDGSVFTWNQEQDSPVRGTKGHTNWVNSIDVSADDAILVAGVSDGTVRVWDLAVGRERHRLQGHGDRVRAVSLSPDGTMILSGATDGTARLWDVQTGESVAALYGHLGAVVAVGYAPNGETLATASGDTVKLWDPGSRRERAELRPGARVSALAFAPDSARIVTTSLDRTAWLWDCASGQGQRLIGHAGPVTCVAFAPDGRTVVTGSTDRTVRRWDLQTGTTVGASLRHPGEVLDVRFAPDGGSVATACADGRARIWTLGAETAVDPGQGRSVRRFGAHAGPVRAVRFSADGRRLVTGSADGTIRVWDGPSLAAGSVLLPLPDSGWAAIFPDGRYKAVGDTSRSVWWAVKAVRFDLDRLDDWVPRIRRIPETSESSLLDGIPVGLRES